MPPSTHLSMHLCQISIPFAGFTPTADIPRQIFAPQTHRQPVAPPELPTTPERQSQGSRQAGAAYSKRC
ncbi:hypothetical protein [Kamptonema formosum]|uniref:hypothetical protein n=1 Tax=Kamptonema formosum TaxID=331992 RepID=UPI0012DF9450|nr:hypothetical protein [Oscillatoria sp. PCC 10802]